MASTSGRKLNIVVEGCCHGELPNIYASVQKMQQVRPRLSRKLHNQTRRHVRLVCVSADRPLRTCCTPVVSCAAQQSLLMDWLAAWVCLLKV